MERTRRNRANEILTRHGYEGVIIYENPSYDTAFIGVTKDNRAVYDYDLMVEYLVTDKSYKMTYEEAVDFISYNSSYDQENYPVIYYVPMDDMVPCEEMENFEFTVLT